MRKCVVVGVAALAVLSFALPNQASAQGVFVGVGGTSPSGDYGEYAKTGWMVDAGFNIPVGEGPLLLFVDGMYGSNGHSDHDGDKTNLLGGFGGVELFFADDSGKGPFVFGQVGFLKHSYKSEEHEEDSTSGLAFGGGAGYAFPIGGLNGFILGRYIQGQTGDDSSEYDDGNTAFLGVSVGASFQVGGNGG